MNMLSFWLRAEIDEKKVVVNATLKTGDKL